ncbi:MULTISPECIES: response regulator transcription factor [unclassified Massilia]|uniref:response regulator n=1 Tax=unclassified Massilia TaxID=2609279 RepID=UPI001B83368F|nr:MULTISPECIES: response regulator transcription factor [unclassified Massilia]MBQ5940299.1 response regulator transcription factor [Massilia sp. AB1]MBQ5962703.1 response regulator transcription factor [Massilia sp. ZL223]
MTDKATIRVFIADDHAIVREGLKQILAEQRDIIVAGEAENGLDATKLIGKARCHVMLLDISLPDRNGIDVLKQVKKDRPELAVLMLSMHREDQYAIRALKAGASGYLTKQSAPKELVTAIRQVASGQKYVSAALAQTLASQIGEDHEAAVHETLSDREYQTLTMIASGMTVSEIAKELSLSVKTISEYRARLLVKMKLKTSAELTTYAIRNGLVD